MVKVIFDELLHTYTTEDGKELRPVTRILSKHGLAGNFDGVPKAVLQRAAERGTMIHKEFELFIRSLGAEVGISEELAWFILHVYNAEEVFLSEVMVWTEGLPCDYAGTIDIVVKTKDGRILLIDIKTGKVHMDWVSWQLSLYRLAYSRMFGVPLDMIDLAVLDAKGQQSSLIPVAPVKESEIMELLSCEAEGLPYVQNLPILAQDKERFLALESQLRQLDLLTKEYDLLKQKFLGIMQANNVAKIFIGNCTLTATKPAVRRVFSEDSLKDSEPELYGQYLKQVTVFDEDRFKAEQKDKWESCRITKVSNPYLKITFKEGK